MFELQRQEAELQALRGELERAREALVATRAQWDTLRVPLLPPGINGWFFIGFTSGIGALTAFLAFTFLQGF